MLSISKKDRAVYLLYSTRQFSSGITVTANIYNDSNSEISGSPFTLSEIDSMGLYGVSFTPLVIGQYKIIVNESSNPVASSGIKITDYDIESIGGVTDSIYTLLGTVSSNITNIQGAGFLTANDSLKAIKDYLVNTVQVAISTINTNTDEVESLLKNATYGLSALKTLIDTYQTTNVAYLVTIDNNVSLIKGYLENTSYGLNALKLLINSLSTDISNFRSSVEGVGFDTSLDSLHAIRTKIDTTFLIPIAEFGT